MHSAPPSSTQLHPHLPTSFQPPPSSIHLYPAHFSLHPALCNILNVIRTKILHVIVNFPKFRPKNSILSNLSENWHTWYLGGSDSKSRLRFLKSRPQNPVLGKLGQKSQSCPFCLNLAHMVSRGCWFLFQH